MLFETSYTVRTAMATGYLTRKAKGSRLRLSFIPAAQPRKTLSYSLSRANTAASQREAFRDVYMDPE